VLVRAELLDQLGGDRRRRGGRVLVDGAGPLLNSQTGIALSAAAWRRAKLRASRCQRLA
jgi:hypothetical protein